MSNLFEKATVFPLNDIAFKWGITIDNYFFMCFDLTEVGAILVQYPECQDRGIKCND